MDADLLLLSVLPSLSVLLNLTTIKHQRGQDDMYIQFGILLIIIVSLERFDQDKRFGYAYIPTVLALSDSILSRASCHSVMIENVWSRRPILQIFLRSTIPASIPWLYLDFAFRTKESFFLLEHSITTTYKLSIFGLSWLCWFLLGLRSRRNILKAVLQFSLPIATNDISNPDERNWDSWDNQQCQNWIMFNYRRRMKYVSEDDLYRILGIFKNERICGESLKVLQKEDFVAMGLSHGDSALIASDILSLNSRYPRQKQENLTTIDLEEWLGKKIGQTSIKPPKLDPAQVFDMNGTSLNALCVDDDNKVLDESGAIQLHTNMDHLTEDISANVIDPNLIDSMPPNVREIASRRPDLVQALFSQRYRSVSEGESGLQAASEEDIEKSEVEGDTFDDHTGGIEQDEWSSENRREHEEMIGLLRRRRNNIV